ncbi:MAG: hypothetical protein J5959_20470 [Butyrivibrio sp.]|nr:hypothetical protein [Butyrivibrio sp.]
MKTFAEMFRRPLSLKAAVGYKNIIWGISLMLMAVSYSVGNTVFRLVITIIALTFSILSFGTLFHKKEEEDEMYSRHIGKASDLTVSIVTLVLLLLGLIAAFLKNYFSMEQVLFFGAGFAGFLQGLLFNVFEKIGY